MSHKSRHQLFCYLDCGYNTKSGPQWLCTKSPETIRLLHQEAFLMQKAFSAPNSGSSPRAYIP